ncbi:retropepsin-like aspartic protease [Anaerohalosphaera lusitana]|nr:retropepsin-like aspartic protease [Anaerohalosphaera lusitana]
MKAIKTLLLTLLLLSATTFAARKDWKRTDVNLRAGTGRTIKAIHHPADKQIPTRAQRRKQDRTTDDTYTATDQTYTAPSTGTAVTVNVVDSPPVDGFVPWIMVTATDKRKDELELEATPRNSIAGTFLSGSPDTYVVGLFDTGASAHVFGYDSSTTLGITGTHLTDNYTVISGVTGSVDALISQPLGVYIAGLDAIDPNGATYDTSKLVGETNTSIMVGTEPIGRPDLPTAIGSPMSVFFETSIRNDITVSRNYNAQTYTGPDIQLRNHGHPDIPTYPNTIPLELRPLGGINVSYITTGLGDDLLNPDFSPTAPSIITGNASQSLFFVHSVDLTEGTYNALDRDRFMLDTGAQVTVIGSRVAARLGLDPASPEFEVEIQGVTGDISMEPGFYIDTLDIPALGNWFQATNVPVVLIDIASPEGGTLDGIIGMNLFTDCNLVLRGGGLFLQDDPVLEYEFIDTPALTGDIAPAGGDGQVNILDLQTFAASWLAVENGTYYNPAADLAPTPPDGYIDYRDFSALANNWLTTTN